jgi:hypothetical protein
MALTDIQKRLVLFLVGCVGTRLLLVYLAATVPPRWLFFMGILALVPAIGFAVIYIGGLRTTGREVFGDRIWWNDLRPLHAALYALFAYLAITGAQSLAWKVLLGDVLVGLAAFLAYHYSEGHLGSLGKIGGD